MSDLVQQRCEAAEEALRGYKLGEYDFDDRWSFHEYKGMEGDRWSADIMLRHRENEPDVFDIPAIFAIVFETGTAEVIEYHVTEQEMFEVVGEQFHRGCASPFSPS